MEEDLKAIYNQLTDMDISVESMVKPEYREQLADLIEEIQETINIKTGLQELVEEKLQEMAHMKGQRDEEEEEESQVLAEAEQLMKKQDYDGALKVLERDMTHKV